MQSRLCHPIALLLLGAAALAVPGCDASPSEVEADPVVETPSAIVNGEIDEGHPAVVALTVFGQPFCSGTLVTPTLVITAAHCLDAVDGGDIEVFFGTDVSLGGTFIPAVQAVGNPNYDGNSETKIDDDIGVVRLLEAGPAEPLPMGNLPEFGTPIIMVGFGITAGDANDAGTKRIGIGMLDTADPKVFVTVGDPGIVCNGDSGGTALAEIDGVETLIGVHTRSDCVAFSLQERIDAHHGDFLAPFLIEPTCDFDGQCAIGCDTPDPDCPCITNAFCNLACGPEDDDCDLCGLGNECIEGCATADPDCRLCIQDGLCELGCSPAPDPDCDTTTATTTSTAGDDGAGGSGGGEGASDGDGEDDGCSVAHPSGTSRRRSAWILAAVALGLVMRRRFALAALLAAGCRQSSGAPEEALPAEAPSPIVDGEVDEGHPASVALTIGGQAFCSGTLVTPTLVVTAAHCLQDEGFFDLQDMEVFFGTSTFQEGTSIGVIQVVPKADWYFEDPRVDDDIGIVRLAEEAPVDPMPIGELPEIGTTITLIGFGTTVDGGSDSGIKRVTTGILEAVEGEIFIVAEDPGVICSGDSGGTALAVIDGVETFVGINTRGDCFEFSIEERVDSHLDDFLGPYLVDPTCEVDGQCALGCDAPDPDCPCGDDICNIECVPTDDPDCDPACAPGNICGLDCPVVDPDCPLCVQDGHCQMGCDQTPDPDCVSSTIGVTSSGSGGEGTGGSGGGSDDAAGAEDGEGCAVARPGEASCDVRVGFLLAGITGIALRRRRRSRR